MIREILAVFYNREGQEPQFIEVDQETFDLAKQGKGEHANCDGGGRFNVINLQQLVETVQQFPCDCDNCRTDREENTALN